MVNCWSEVCLQTQDAWNDWISILAALRYRLYKLKKVQNNNCQFLPGFQNSSQGHSWLRSCSFTGRYSLGTCAQGGTWKAWYIQKSRRERWLPWVEVVCTCFKFLFLTREERSRVKCLGNCSWHVVGLPNTTFFSLSCFASLYCLNLTKLV